MTVRLLRPMTRFTQLYQTSEWLTVHPLLCPVLLPAAWFPPWVLTSARELHDYLHLRRSEPFRSAGGGGLESLIQEGRQSARLWHHTLYAVLSVPGNKRHLFFRARLGKKPSPSRLAWLDSCRVLCCANCNLAGVGGDASHWYCQSPCFPITIACTPTWLPDWQCYFRGNYYDSDYVNHSALCSALHQIAAARAARFFYFFISPHVSDGCLRYILSFLQ